MKLIGYARYKTIQDIENEYKGRFSVTGDGESHVSLHINQTRVIEDSALYFCAASYAQCLITPSANNKNLLLFKSTKPHHHMLIRMK